MIVKDIIEGIASPILSIIDKVVPDKDLKEKLKYEVNMTVSTQIFQYVMKLIDSRAKALVAEIEGHSWLQRNWRPLVMLTFTGLIVARWLGYTIPNISPELETQLFEIVKIGLGGYVLGRSAEKIAKYWKAKD